MLYTDFKNIAALIVFFFISLFVSCEPFSNPTETIKKGNPVATSNYDELTMNSVQLYGYINADYILTNDEVGFIVSTSSSPSLDNGRKVISKEVDNNGKYFVSVSGLTPSTTYYYKAFMSMGAKYLVGDVKSFTTKSFEFVAIDMGLSVKWANANLGATTFEGYGDYYAWGEIQTKDEYTWANYKWANGSSTSIFKYNDGATNGGSYGPVDHKIVLEKEDDVAQVKLGGNWRLPTFNEINELVATTRNESYKWQWKSVNGHNGWEVIYNVNGNSIFFPAAGYKSGSNLGGIGEYGYYWSNTLGSGYPVDSYYFHISSTEVERDDYSRCWGFSVRPVSD